MRPGHFAVILFISNLFFCSGDNGCKRRLKSAAGGHGCDVPVQKCGIFMNNEACIALLKTR
jgi:hypothetical protein